MEAKKVKGVVVLAAATLFIAGAGHAQESGAGSVKATCFGGHACKGHGQCATNSNGCKSMNECK